MPRGDLWAPGGRTLDRASKGTISDNLRAPFFGTILDTKAPSFVSNPPRGHPRGVPQGCLTENQACREAPKWTPSGTIFFLRVRSL